MENDRNMTRREGLRNALLLGAAANLGLAADHAQTQEATSNGKVLVAYFTRTGNTQIVARKIRRAFDADLFEIRTAEPYPEDYEETVSQAQRERDSGFEPTLAETIPDLGRYDVIFLGFPIWGMTAPPVIRSFLSSDDLSGTTLIPFITHGGYGLGQSLAVLAERAPGARLLDAFSMQADQEREILSQVTDWRPRKTGGGRASGVIPSS
jgi:flavodoxin